MADPRLNRISLSSPGDVPLERDDAQADIDEINASGEFDRHVILRLYRWNDERVVLPMPATATPQESEMIFEAALQRGGTALDSSRRFRYAH
jgi:hypothetical protein